MKVSLFCNTRYTGPSPQGVWPVPGDCFSPEIAVSSMNRTLDQMRLGDEVGFDWLTVAEHHFAPFSMSPNPNVLAGALTQVAKRAKIALLGPDIPVLNPVRVAEEIAMLDTISGGRIIAGIMRGTPNEYVTYNINPSESRGRFQEALHLIRACWTEPQPFGWQGRYYQHRTISIWPRPIQQPHPPIYMSAATPESGEFAAENRIGIGFAFTTVQRAAVAATYYRQQAELHGWTPTPDHVIYRLAMHCTDTDEEGIEDLIQASAQATVGLSMTNKALAKAVAESSYYGRDAENQIARAKSRGEINDRIENAQVLVGTPKTIIAQIKRIKDILGPGILDLSIGAQMGQKTLKSIEMFGQKVLPEIHAL